MNRQQKFNQVSGRALWIFLGLVIVVALLLAFGRA